MSDDITAAVEAPVVEASVAVLMRTKNRPLLLRRALQSVLSQTYADFCVVVVNDAGEREPVDREIAAVAELARGRVAVIHNERSNGREAAVNVGIRASGSRYLVIHDDDDSWAPGFLEATVAYLENSPDAGVATRTAVVFERIDGATITRERSEVLASDKHQVALLDMIFRNYAPPISILYRRAVHDTIGLFDESLPVLADWDFNLRFLSEFTMGFIDGEPLAFWHQRPNAEGAVANSVWAESATHAQYDSIIRDRFLRKDLSRNAGLGTLLYLAEVLHRRQRDVQDQISSVHAYVGAVRSAEERDHEATIAQLLELNRNLVSQNNRLVAQYQMLDSRVTQLASLVVELTPRARLHSYRQALVGRLDRLASCLR